MELYELFNVELYKTRLPNRRKHLSYYQNEMVLESAEATIENMYLNSINELGFFKGKFIERNMNNIPGPFFGADTDTCCAGPGEAPRNVLLDEEGYEFVYMQPSSVSELRDTICAAYVDPFSGYGADGNDNWTFAQVREWWCNREHLTESIRRQLEDPIEDPETAWYEGQNSKTALLRCLNFIENEMKAYLRAYSYFLEEGRNPTGADTLPDLA